MSRYLQGLVALACCATLLLGAPACQPKTNQEQAQEEAPSPAQLLLTQAQGLARLELATVRMKVVVRIDPHRDGLLSFKKLFGSKLTRIELRSQASVSCDLRLLTEEMVTLQPDSSLLLQLPPLAIHRELDDLDQHVLQEPTGLRRRLSTNELNELLASKQDLIDSRFDSALERYRPELVRSAYGTLTQRLFPLFSHLGVRVTLLLAPEDARLLSPAP